MQLSRESPKQYLNKFFTLEMKILRFIFAIPLGILLSFLSFYVVNMLIIVAKFINTSNYPISDYLSTLASGAVLVSAITYIAPSKRKIFLFIALFIGLIIFISNIIFKKDIQFAFIVGVIATFLSIYKDVKYDKTFIKEKRSEEKNISVEYHSKISQLNTFEPKNEFNDPKNIDVSERAKRTINKPKKKRS